MVDVRLVIHIGIELVDEKRQDRLVYTRHGITAHEGNMTTK